MNEDVTYHVLKAAIDSGVREFIICPGSRNSSFVEALRVEERLMTFYWPEERSAAFFALGRSRFFQRPVAIVTTSGTASGELLPAAMEAYYSCVPLILITTDRPRRFRGSGAPQSAEQVGLFGHYASLALDVGADSHCDLSKWNQRGPIHINVCLEEPQSQPKFSNRSLTIESLKPNHIDLDYTHTNQVLNRFLSTVNYPLVIVSTLPKNTQEEVADFLLSIGAPAFLEGVSDLREDSRLQSLRIKNPEKILETAQLNNYPIDGILRIGGIPTHRIWRDLEYKKNHIKVCSVSHLPFSGLSWNRNVICGPINLLLKQYVPTKSFPLNSSLNWLQAQGHFEEHLKELIEEEPSAEPSLIHKLSSYISESAHIYLGNSLPIREWDLAATNSARNFTLTASRGLNGIDGQISTFLGLCHQQRDNWGILGDLTTLYDMVGCWILPQLESIKATIVVVNNGGGKIFTRMFPHKEMLNLHGLNFEPLAKMWGLNYEYWETIPVNENTKKPQKQFNLIEIVPDNNATSRFWEKFNKRIQQHSIAVQLGA